MSKHYVDIFNAMAEGNASKALQLQHQVNEVTEVLVKVGVYQGIKFAMKEKGIDYGECRKPFLPLCDEHKAQLIQVLGKI